MPILSPNPNTGIGGAPAATPPMQGQYPGGNDLMRQFELLRRAAPWLFPPKGLVDPGVDVQPDLGVPPQGLLKPQPVIFDRFRQQRGLNSGLLGTEGAQPAYSGGGRGMLQEPRQGELPLQGGREISRNVTHRPPERPPVESKWNWTQYGEQRTTDTPSGVRVLVTQEPRRAGADVVFYEPGGFRAQAGRLGGERNPSTKQGIQRFSDVFDAIKDYVARYDPRALTFSGASDAHAKLYDRVAPMMAKELGGKFHRTDLGEFIIQLPRTGFEDETGD